MPYTHKSLACLWLLAFGLGRPDRIGSGRGLVAPPGHPDRAFGAAPHPQESASDRRDLALTRTCKDGLGRAVVERVGPTRVVFDSLSDLKLMAREPLRFRRQILALKEFFAGR